MPIMMDPVQAKENSPLNEMKKAKDFQPSIKLSDSKPTVV